VPFLFPAQYVGSRGLLLVLVILLPPHHHPLGGWCAFVVFFSPVPTDTFEQIKRLWNIARWQKNMRILENSEGRKKQDQLAAACALGKMVSQGNSTACITSVASKVGACRGVVRRLSPACFFF
jgi:hypothetical protein